MKKKNLFFVLLAVALLSVLIAGCAPAAPAEEATEEPMQEDTASATEEPMVEEVELSGDILIDGSSTVFPITSAVAEEFLAVAPDVRVSVGLSGTGGGFKKFCPGEIDISDASRPIKDEEIALCEENGVEFVELTIAMDGLTVMVNPANDWLTSLSPDQIAALFGASSTIVNWSDLDPAFPNEPIKFYVPDPDSGTRDYMIEVVEKVNGDEDLRQDDNTSFSSDDNVLLDGIANDEYAIGFFGFAYYISNADKVTAVAIVNDAGEAVLPSDETVQDGSYNPLSRPLFVYVNVESLTTKPQVEAFVRFMLSEEGVPYILPDVGYSMPVDGTYEADIAAVNALLGE